MPSIRPREFKWHLSNKIIYITTIENSVLKCFQFIGPSSQHYALDLLIDLDRISTSLSLSTHLSNHYKNIASLLAFKRATVKLNRNTDSENLNVVFYRNEIESEISRGF